MGGRLIAITGPLAGQEFPLPRVATTLGADPQNHISWPDSQLAPDHAHIRWQQDHHILVDLGSESGIYVNGQRVNAPHRLRSGDRIRIGNSTFLYLFPQQETPFSRTTSAPFSPAAERGKLLPGYHRRSWMVLVILVSVIIILLFIFFIFPWLWRNLRPPRQPTTISLTPTRTPTFGSFLPTTTPTPEAKPKYYPVPILLGPADGTVGTKITLQWSWRGALEIDEWYEVWVWREGEEPRSLAWTKTPQYDVGPELAPGLYSWQVIVVQGAAQGQWQRDLSAPSEIRHFTLVSLTSTPTPRPTASATSTIIPTLTSTPTPTSEPIARAIVSGTVYDAHRGLEAPIANAEVRVYLSERRVTTRTDASGKYTAEFRLQGQVVEQRIDVIATVAGYEPGMAYAFLTIRDPEVPHYVHIDLGLLPAPTATPTWLPPTATQTMTPTLAPTGTATFTMIPTATVMPSLTATPSDTPMPTTVTPAPDEG